MKDILFSVVMSFVLFFAVSYVHRAKADACGGANCAIQAPLLSHSGTVQQRQLLIRP